MSYDFIPAAKPIIGDDERAAVDAVLATGMLAQGQQVADFEKEFSEVLLDGRSSVAVNSGTSGLHLGLLAAGVKAGDEVIVPSFTFAATGNSVALTGATPVFADIELDHYTLDVDHVASLITDKTKGIMPVHLYGHPFNVEGLGKLAARARHRPLRGRRPGPRCQLQRPEGGNVRQIRHVQPVPHEEHDLRRGRHGQHPRRRRVERNLRLLRNQGMEKQYENELVGFNARMTDLHASIGRVQLKKVLGWTKTAPAERGLPRCEPPRRRHAQGRRGRVHVYHQYTIRVPEDRDGLREGTARGIQRRHRRLLPGSQPPTALVQPHRRPSEHGNRCPRASSPCRCTRR
jgi:perosamine synthetase